jgi:hypothetical protein
MVTSRKDENPRSKRPSATTPQGRENQLIALAYDVVEQKLLSGTASSQETVHFLKLGTERERLERKKLEQETLLAEAKVEQMSSQARIEDLYEKAMSAFSGYQPSKDDDFDITS